jgi:glycosyltransferase involved in cell wall biosynthesis
MSAPLTIILPTYDRRHVLERSIGSYLELARRWPLLVVDDGSHDGTADWLTSLGIRVLRLPHGGLPAARNAGMASVQTPWVLFGEDDVLMQADGPGRLLAWAGRLPRCTAVCGRSCIRDDWRLEETGGPADPLDGPRMLIDLSGPFAAPRLLPSLHARSLIDRRAALAIGGFDASLVGSAFREESDFFARLWHRGGACWQVPDVCEVHVRHRLGGGCRGATDRLAKLRNRWTYWRNNARFIDRHRRMWQHWAPIPEPGGMKLRYAYELVAAGMRAARG